MKATTIIAPMFLKNDSPKLVPLNADTPLSVEDEITPPILLAPDSPASLIAVKALDTLSIVLNPVTLDIDNKVCVNYNPALDTSRFATIRTPFPVFTLTCSVPVA